MTKVIFRSYAAADREACISVFDANCPEFFAPNERQDFEEFLEQEPADYEICEGDGKVLGAFGLFVDGENTKTLNWILLDPQTQGMGVGSKIMKRVIQLGHTSQTKVVKIAASHKSAPFFARFGASKKTLTENGWGPGMDRVDMELQL